MPGITRPASSRSCSLNPLARAASRSFSQPGQAVADAEGAADLVGEAAPREVLARRRGRLGLPEHALVVGRGLLEQRAQALAAAALGVAVSARLLVLERDAVLVGEVLDGLGEVEVLLGLTKPKRLPPAPQPKQ